ncbi:B-cell receptor CD22-like [Anguilla anguilla]|uniref:B-cell receptor CD22-like n=1 Tax=Anguilla anguilla TaxID=7936 RepID=UPI0015AA49F5|nr:B-cell receptor CD22-like [Anguilla anguilla]
MLFNTLLVIILSVSGALSEEGWGVTYTPERICALKESSIGMNCTYSYPTSHTVQKTFWFIHWNKAQEPEDLSQDPEYSHRVEYLGNKHSDCTFRINQLRKNDSKTYRFRFLTASDKYTGDPGVTLEVTDLQVMVNPDTVKEGQSVRLNCSTTCTLTGSPAFIWYRDGSPLPFTDQSHQFTARNEDAGRYSCAVKGYELHSPAVTLNVICVLSQSGWGVTYTPERICALKGSSVDMSCTYSYPTSHTVQKTFWFIHWNKPQEHEDLSQTPEYSDRVEYLGNKNSDCTFRIKHLRETDSKTYKFRFLTDCDRGKYTGEPGVTLAITDLQVMVNPNSVTEGQSVRLNCSTTCTLTGSPAFIWYRDGSPLSFTDQSHQFTASSEDAGRYSCAVKGYELHSPAVALNVRYRPKSTSVAVSPSGEIVEGSSMTLTCSSDANPPVQNYTWVKKNDTGVWQAGSGQSLNFSNFGSWNRGQYYCEAQNRLGAQNASALLVTVQGGQSLIAAAAVGVAAILALVFLGVVCLRYVVVNESVCSHSSVNYCMSDLDS